MSLVWWGLAGAVTAFVLIKVAQWWVRWLVERWTRP